MIPRFIIFIILNFVGLALGGLFTGDGVASDWYQNLNKAPWTPPGWVFGTAWTIIMICFAFYMTFIWEKVDNKRELVKLFVFQWILNFGWNPVFFYSQNIGLGLIVILALTILIGFIGFRFLSRSKTTSIWLMPYFIWLLLATSLNIYIFLSN